MYVKVSIGIKKFLIFCRVLLAFTRSVHFFCQREKASLRCLVNMRAVDVSWLQIIYQGWIGYAGTHVPMFVPWVFLNENDSLAYFAILEELSSGLSVTMGFSKLLRFLSLLVGFFRGQGRTYLPTPWCFSWLNKTNYQKKFCFIFSLNLKDIQQRHS